MMDDSFPKSPAERHEPGRPGGSNPVDFSNPTAELYDDLCRAYSSFNQRLFGGRLQPCLITLRARGKVPGYFYSLRFLHKDGRHSHEIALNPESFDYSNIEQCLSTLVHEMVHQAQFEDGTGGQRGYHNLDFARRMLEIGLPASSTGRPDGKSTGHKMSHYIAPDGAFLVAVHELLDLDFKARWADRFVSERGIHRIDKIEPLDQYAPNTQSMGTFTQGNMDASSDNRIQLDAGGPQSVNASTSDITKQRASKDPSKVKFMCPNCRQAAWGKKCLTLVCGKCLVSMPAMR